MNGDIWILVDNIHEHVTDRKKNLALLSKDQMILEGTHVIAFSALKGDGRDEILSIIERKALEK